MQNHATTSTARSRTSPKCEPCAPARDEEFIEKQIALLAGNYANSALAAAGTATMELYFDELSEMLRLHDRQRVAQAISRAIRTSRFLPEISVLWELIPPAPERPRFDPNCGECRGSGWRYLPTATGSAPRVDRCTCHLRRGSRK